MKAKIIISILFLSLFVVGVSASEQVPILVSPGNDVGIAVVGEVCPTFSWTAVNWALGYMVEVYSWSGSTGNDYQDSAASSLPIFSKYISGAATSWTPSWENRLSPGQSYIWYVQALDSRGGGPWSTGRTFLVEQLPGFTAVEETVGDILRERGMEEDFITDVLLDLDVYKDKGLIVHKGTPEASPVPIGMSVQGLEGSSNTFYGLDAGNGTLTGYNNTFIGRQAGLASTNGFGNTFLGHQSGYVNTTGDENVFVGTWTGNANTSGYYNVFIGSGSGVSNTTGNSNTFLGRYSGYSNIDGLGNTFLGKASGYANSSGRENTFVGSQAGISNTTGQYNTFLGYNSGNKNTSGNSNIFIGYEAGYDNTEGNENIFIGTWAGKDNTTGLYNTFIGFNAGSVNTTGDTNTFIGNLAGFSNTTGNNNTYLGHQTGYTNTWGLANTFLGRRAGYSNETGDSNVYVGYLAGNNNASGHENTLMGSMTGYSLSSGNWNTMYGFRAGNSLSSGHGNLFLGYKAGYNETGSNKMYIDNSDTSDPLIYGEFDNDVVALMGTFGVGTKSPAFPMEMKKTGTNASIVVDRTDGATNYINATATFGNFGTVTNHPLRLVVNSLWKMRLNSDTSLTMRNGASCTAGGVWTDASSRELKENIDNLTAEKARDALEGLQPVTYNYKADKEDDHVGFIAEDVPDLVASKDRKGMSPMDVVAVLTKVLQEQQKTIDELKAEVELLKNESKSDK